MGRCWCIGYLERCHAISSHSDLTKFLCNRPEKGSLIVKRDDTFSFQKFKSMCHLNQKLGAELSWFLTCLLKLIVSADCSRHAIKIDIGTTLVKPGLICPTFKPLLGEISLLRKEISPTLRSLFPSTVYSFKICHKLSLVFELNALEMIF